MRACGTKSLLASGLIASAACGSNGSRLGVDGGRSLAGDEASTTSDGGIVQAAEADSASDSEGTLESGAGVASESGIAQGDAASAVSGDGATVGDAALPPIDPSTEIKDLLNAQLGLTDTQKAELCDWWMTEVGGYGTVVQCSPTGGGATSVQNPSNQAECVSTFSDQFHCTVTVGDFETCVLAQAPSKGCDYPAPQCDAVLCNR